MARHNTKLILSLMVGLLTMILPTSAGAQVQYGGCANGQTAIQSVIGSDQGSVLCFDPGADYIGVDIDTLDQTEYCQPYKLTPSPYLIFTDDISDIRYGLSPAGLYPYAQTEDRYIYFEISTDNFFGLPSQQNLDIEIRSYSVSPNGSQIIVDGKEATTGSPFTTSDISYFKYFSQTAGRYYWAFRILLHTDVDQIEHSNISIVITSRGIEQSISQVYSQGFRVSQNANLTTCGPDQLQHPDFPNPFPTGTPAPTSTGTVTATPTPTGTPSPYPTSAGHTITPLPTGTSIFQYPTVLAPGSPTPLAQSTIPAVSFPTISTPSLSAWTTATLSLAFTPSYESVNTAATIQAYSQPVEAIATRWADNVNTAAGLLSITNTIGVSNVQEMAAELVYNIKVPFSWARILKIYMPNLWPIISFMFLALGWIIFNVVAKFAIAIISDVLDAIRKVIEMLPFM